MEMAGTTDHSQYLFVVSKSSECGAGLYLWLQNWICSCLRDGNQSLHKLVHWSHHATIIETSQWWLNYQCRHDTGLNWKLIDNSFIDSLYGKFQLLVHLAVSSVLRIWLSFTIKMELIFVSFHLCHAAILILLKSLCVLYLIACVILSY